MGGCGGVWGCVVIWRVCISILIVIVQESMQAVAQHRVGGVIITAVLHLRGILSVFVVVFLVYYVTK